MVGNYVAFATYCVVKPRMSSKNGANSSPFSCYSIGMSLAIKDELQKGIKKTKFFGNQTFATLAKSAVTLYAPTHYLNRTIGESGRSAVQIVRKRSFCSLHQKPFSFDPRMATQATELTDSDAEYAGPISPTPTRTRTPRLRDRLTFRTNVIPLYHALLEPVSYSRLRASVGTDRATRILNIFVAALGLVLALPLFLVIAIAIKLSSRGPVFYKQTRIGLDRRWNSAPSNVDSRIEDLGGKPFTMYKFRTMVTTAETEQKEVWATPFDGRVTKLGRRLRNTRLDKLPQLLNVLFGDMNIVGPRPEQPTIFAELREVIPNYHMRQRVMPGITGWAQVNLAYDTSVDDVRRKVEYDLEYLNTRSAAGDLRIMARTLPIVLSSRLGW